MEAAEHEDRCNWKEAANCYDAFLEGSLHSPESVDIAFRSAQCHAFAAFQAGDVESFRAEIEAWRSVMLGVQREFDKDHSSLPYRRARVGQIFAESTLVIEGRQRRPLLDEALDIHRTVLADSELQQGKIPLLLGNFHLLMLEERRLIDDGGNMSALITESLALSEKLTSSPSESDADQLAAAYASYVRSILSASRYFDEWAKNPSRGSDVVEKAINILPRVRSKFVLFRLNLFIALHNYFRGRERGRNEYFSAALAAARITRIRPLIYLALAYEIGTATLFDLLAERNGEQASRIFQDILSSFEEAKKNLSHFKTGFWTDYTLVYFYRLVVPAHYEYAKHCVTDPDLKRRLAERGVELFREGWPLAELTETLPGVWLAQMAPEALRYLASLEPGGQRRQELLTEAISISEKARTLHSRIEPSVSRIEPQWTGEAIIQQGMIRHDLAREIRDATKKKEMLRGALDRFREGLEMAEDVLHEFPGGRNTPGMMGAYTSLGGYLINFAKALGDLFELTNEPILLDEQLNALDRAAESYSRAERPPRVAEVLWQKAKIRSKGGQYREASQEFKRSSQEYEKATFQTPSLRGLYTDLTKYMIGWSQIEEARSAHGLGLYQDASQAYMSAVKTFGGTQRWLPLGELYLACSTLEKAEAASYEEDSESAFQLFEQAADHFSASQAATASWDPQILGEGGREEVLGWKKVAIAREQYCHARAEVEDAKLLYHKGEHAPSARRFAGAKIILEGLAEGEEREGKQELDTLALICAAWQSMEEAEATSSSEKYVEASRIFERASDSATSERVALLARGHAAYCDALKLGTGLRSRRDPEAYRQTKESLEVAIDSYTKAGVQRGALWAGGTERVLDGLIFLGKAESELDVKTKAQLYALSERSFEAAAKLYEEANFTSKQAQANQYLQMVKARRVIFASPADALDPSFVLSAQEIAPSLTRDQPLGVERFEAANLQGNLAANRAEIAMGESVIVVLQLVSAGRSPAILVKLTGIDTPGLEEVEMVGGKYRVSEEGGEVNFKGHRMDPFETLDIEMKIKPSRVGEFTFQPTVLYLDESNTYRRYQTNSSVFRVVPSIGREGRSESQSAETGGEIKFDNPTTKVVFDCLLSAFIEDYMVRKLFMDQAGWRSLTKVSDASRIPHSSLYGKQGGRFGPSIEELLSRGLAETRVFTGQRGRGGEVIRVRIAYGKEPVKRYVDAYVMKPKND